MPILWWPSIRACIEKVDILIWNKSEAGTSSTSSWCFKWFTRLDILKYSTFYAMFYDQKVQSVPTIFLRHRVNRIINFFPFFSTDLPILWKNFETSWLFDEYFTYLCFLELLVHQNIHHIFQLLVQCWDQLRHMVHFQFSLLFLVWMFFDMQ